MPNWRWITAHTAPEVSSPSASQLSWMCSDMQHLPAGDEPLAGINPLFTLVGHQEHVGNVMLERSTDEPNGHRRRQAASPILRAHANASNLRDPIAGWGVLARARGNCAWGGLRQDGPAAGLERPPQRLNFTWARRLGLTISLVLDDPYA